MLLLEKSLFKNPKQEKIFNNSTPEQQIKYLTGGEAFKELDNDGNEVNTYLNILIKDKSDNRYNYISTILKSLSELGYDEGRNPFLTFLFNPQTEKLHIPENSKIPDILYDTIKNKNINPSQKWLYDDRAYNGSEYKFRSLALLNSPNASRYGNVKNKDENGKTIIDRVLESKDDNNIKFELSNWQSKNGDEDRITYNKKTGDISKILKDNSREINKYLKSIESNKDYFNTIDKLFPTGE